MVHKFLLRFSLLLVAAFMTAGITSAQEGTGWKYDESTKTLTLSGDEVDWTGFADYKSTTKKVVFSNNYTVKTIADNAFKNFSKLKQIEIPDCVTSIGNEAFESCSSLTSVSLPDGIHSIGYEAFGWCSSLSSVNFPKGLQRIRFYAFYGCNALLSVTLPASLNKIGDGAFGSCYRLNVVKVLSNGNSDDKHYIQLGDSGDSMSATGEDVFPKGQATLVYDEDKTWIGNSDKENLRSYFDNFVTSTAVTNKGWKYDDKTNTLTLSGNEVAWHEFTNYASTTEEVVFTKDFNVASIGCCAFSCFSNLTKIEIPNCVTSFGNRAFYECSSLASVNLPDGLKSIGDNAFYNCLSLTSIDFPNGLQSIGYNAFMQCEYLTAVNLPEELEDLGDFVFWGCDNLGSVEFPDGLKSIGNYTFVGCDNLVSVKFPKGLKSIGDHAFSWCSSLTSVSLPEGLQSIGNEAFYSCQNLSAVVFPEGLESIGNGAFKNCNSYQFTSITLPATLNHIGDYAFYDCTFLKTVTLRSNGTSEKKHYILLGDDNDDDKTAIGENVFPKRQATLVHNPNTTWVGNGAGQNLLYYFYGHTQETALNIPTTSAPAQYYDLAGRKVNMENHKGIVVKVQNGKSKLIMIK